MCEIDYFCIPNSNEMKRFLTAILTLVITYSLAVPAEAKKKEEENALIRMLESYEEAKGVEYFNLNGMILKMAKPSIKKTPVGKAADNIENLCIFSMSDAGKEVRARFLKEADLLLKGYDMVLETTEDKTTSRIYMKKADAEIIDELIVYSQGKDIAIIYMIGDIPLSALEGMTPKSEEPKEK